MTRNAADSAAAVGTRAAEKYVLQFRFTPPRTDLFSCFGEGKRQCVLEDIAVVEPERFLDVDRTFVLNAKTAIACDSNAIFERLRQPAI